MMPAGLSLASVDAKISRAEEHARTLDEELSAWMKEAPYAFSRQVNSDFTRHSVVVSITTPPPLQRWSLIFGDAIHNLRCALDHLVYAISVYELHADPPPNEGSCAFIINDRPEDFRSKYFRIKPLSLPVKQAIESVQPYNRKHPEMPPLLAMLRDFDDADKHRLIKVLLQRPFEWDINLTGRRISPDDFIVETPFVELVDGAEIASVTCKRPTPNLGFTGKLSLGIFVGHAPGPGTPQARIERTSVEVILVDYLIPEVKEVASIVSSAVA